MYDPRVAGPAPHLAAVHARRACEHGVLTPDQARQVRACYGAKLTMIDAWFGRVLDALDRARLWDDTAVIVCTDHGHYLGEKDIWGKPAVPVYEPLGHIPLLIAWPGVAPRRGRRADHHASTSTRRCATCSASQSRTARTAARCCRCSAARRRAVRDCALSGVWGREVHLIDATPQVRARARPATTRRSACGRTAGRRCRCTSFPTLRLPLPDERAVLDRMPGSTVPVIRQPFAAGDLLPFWAMGPFRGNHLFDLADDPSEERNLAGIGAEQQLAEKLRAALREIEAPDDQFVRLGLE